MSSRYWFPVVVTGLVLSLIGAGAATAKLVDLDAAVGSPVLSAGEKQTTYLRVALTCEALPSQKDRPPVNLAVVLDRSGSMQGEKIRQAKEAAEMVVERLNSSDIFSFVTYETSVEVVVPATKLTDKEQVVSKIQAIGPAGSTALFGGVSKGAEELRKFFDKNRVNRIILLSDGLANVGPQSPGELGSLGECLGREGISVTTIGLGLGYNEDLMAQLAMKSEGNHIFAEQPSDLAKAFDAELGDVLSVAAQEAKIEISCHAGVRPVRFLGREGEIIDGKAYVDISQLYAKQTKYAILEVEVPANQKGRQMRLASVRVAYTNMLNNDRENLSSDIEVTFTDSKDLVEKSTNKEVMVSVVRQIGVENQKLAVSLRDKGQIEEARQTLIENSRFLRKRSIDLNSPRLSEDAGWSEKQEASIENEAQWQQSRKEVLDQETKTKLQGLGYTK